MRALWDNGLTIALMGAFLFCVAAMTLSGWLGHNEQLADHGDRKGDDRRW